MIDVANAVIYYYHFDGLGSVVALSDSSGNMVERYSYDVFGEPNVTSSVGNPYLFTGRRYDSETGLYYYRARYYSPEIGRFLQTDPIGYYDSMNLYQYCLNNPVYYVDPYGEGRIGQIAGSIGRGIKTAGNWLWEKGWEVLQFDNPVGDYAACMGRCIGKYDPLGLVTKSIPPALAWTVKKAAPQGTQKVRTFWISTRPWVAKKLGITMSMGQKIGRYSQYALIAEGALYIGIEGYCAAKCLKCPNEQFRW